MLSYRASPTWRLYKGLVYWCTLLPFHPLLGYPAESGRWQAHNTQQTTLRINKPVDTHIIDWNGCRPPPPQTHLEYFLTLRSDHSFSLKCDKCCLCYSICNCDFTICTCANLLFMIPYSSVKLFKYLQLKWLPFFGFYVGSYKLGVPKKRCLQHKY